jgi:hypothetical protein
MDIGRSRLFYEMLLGLEPVREWTESQGNGCIFPVGEEEATGFIEVYEMNDSDERYKDEFARPLETDKVDVQFNVPLLDAWVQRLKGKWDFDGPSETPWGQTWIRLRDPDNLLIALVEDSV